MDFKPKYQRWRAAGCQSISFRFHFAEKFETAPRRIMTALQQKFVFS
jgi:hypothetical protein